MKKTSILLFTLVIGMNVSLLAQEKSVNDSTQTKAQLSGTLFWGLFTWGDYDSLEKNKKGARSRVSTEMDELMSISIDTTRYEKKSILGGAVQWTERKRKRVKSDLGKKQ